ncbi:MAG: hypothetical protein GEV28_29890 [Actinophytocola sp.]|nr:hypothetical protein [Actinophytocola sp.]
MSAVLIALACVLPGEPCGGSCPPPLPKGVGDSHQAAPKKTGPETAPCIHRRLIALTLAEIRRLLNLIPRNEHAIAHGLHWSVWRRRHQAEARRVHVRRRLHLQALMI